MSTVLHACAATLSDSPLTPIPSSNLLLWGEDSTEKGDRIAEQFWGDIIADLIHRVRKELDSGALGGENKAKPAQSFFMENKNQHARGRGAGNNPPNRFERLFYEHEHDHEHDHEPDSPDTVLLKDTSRTIIAYNDSPDVGFDASINPYRGCEHGCVYCYARPTHEYLGFSAGLD